MKKLITITAGLALSLAIIAAIALNTPSVQDALLARGLSAVMSASSEQESDALRVLVCGSSSPLPAPGRAQACIAIITPDHFYIIDSGAGSTVNVNFAGLPTQRLDGVLLTHFHSDHIAELYELNLASWVQGRPRPMQVFGPEGVTGIIAGINETYALDRGYRVAHHTAELLAPELGVLQAQAISPGIVIEDADLTISAILVDHAPVAPAVAYHINYKGRTVLVTGDTVMTEGIAKAAQDIDLLLTDALSMPILESMETAAKEAGRPRTAKIFRDVMDYHAHTDTVLSLAKQANVKLTAYYHMVPAPSNIIMEKIYQRDMPDNVVLSEDGMWFELAVGTDEVTIR